MLHPAPPLIPDGYSFNIQWAGVTLGLALGPQVRGMTRAADVTLTSRQPNRHSFPPRSKEDSMNGSGMLGVAMGGIAVILVWRWPAFGACLSRLALVAALLVIWRLVRLPGR